MSIPLHSGRRPRTGRLRLVAACVLVAAPLALLGCDSLMTTEPDPGDLFDAPLEGLTPAERSAFIAADEQFGKPFAIAEGLGPIFNNVSCAACHSGDGRGNPANILTRTSLAGDPALEYGGPQLQDRAIPGAEA